MSTRLLIGRTPAACSRAAIQAGELPMRTSATAAANRGQSSASAIATAMRSEAPDGIAASATRAPAFADGSVNGRLYAVATSRARPITLRPSGRFAVISKSITASPPPSGSIDATSKPRDASVFATSSADALTSTNSRSQDKTSFMSVRELLEESQIVLVEQPDVLDLIAENRDALDADAPREAGVFLRVVAHRLEHRRVDHAAAEDFDPAALLAHRAADAVARPAADVHFGARLRVREEARTEPQPRLLAEHVAREGEQRPLQVRQRDPFADDEPFHLREHRRVRQIQIVAAVHAPRHDDTDRRLVRLHVADLHRGRVRPQHRADERRRIAVDGRHRAPQ